MVHFNHGYLPAGAPAKTRCQSVSVRENGFGLDGIFPQWLSGRDIRNHDDACRAHSTAGQSAQHDVQTPCRADREDTGNGCLGLLAPLNHQFLMVCSTPSLEIKIPILETLSFTMVGPMKDRRVLGNMDRDRSSVAGLRRRGESRRLAHLPRSEPQRDLRRDRLAVRLGRRRSEGALAGLGGHGLVVRGDRRRAGLHDGQPRRGGRSTGRHRLLLRRRDRRAAVETHLPLPAAAQVL